MSDSIIASAIEGRLATWAAAQVPPIPVAWENVTYAPVTGQRYLRGFLMPANTENPSQGGKHKHHHGIYQVSVFIPANPGAGAGAARTIANDIKALFACPTTIVKSGINVNILRSPATAQGIPDDTGFYMVPVTIWYDADDFS
jgi:hypothetical protein